MSELKPLKYKIGDTIQGPKSISVVQDITSERNAKGILVRKYHCLCQKCGFVFQKERRGLENHNTGCPVCANRMIVVGVNDMWTTHPQIANMLTNPQDGYECVVDSQKKIDWTCPNCGQTIHKAPTTVKRQGLACPNCSEGISFPNRFMRLVLQELNVNYIAEATFPWSGKKRYDFYLPDHNMIIEVQGEQHYTNRTWNRTGLIEVDQHQNDALKKKLAIENDVQHYVYVFAKTSDINYLIKSVKSSDLSLFFDLSRVNWENTKECLYTTTVGKTVELWKNGLRIQEIAEQLDIGRQTVRKYLKRAVELGLCDYDTETSQWRGTRKGSHPKPVLCVTTGEEFPSASAAERHYGVRHVAECCNGKLTRAGTYDGKSLEWKFLNV